MMQSHSFYTPQKNNVSCIVYKKQLSFDLELYMRLLINFNHYLHIIIREYFNQGKMSKNKIKIDAAFNFKT